MSPTRLYTQQATRIECAWYCPDTCEWWLFVATPNRNAPFDQLLGTALVLRADGSASRVTVQPDGSVDQMDVMPPSPQQGMKQ